MESVIVKRIRISSIEWPSSVAWAANRNVIALAFGSKASLTAKVLVSEPNELEEYIALDIPLKDEDDYIKFISFSPVHSTLTLLTATSEGNVVLWSPRPDQHSFKPLASNVWDNVTTVDTELEDPLVFCEFLAGASSHRWPPKESAHKSQPHSSLSMEKRFYTDDHVLMGDQPYIRISVPHFITIDSSSHFRMFWKTIEGWVSTEIHKLLCDSTTSIIFADVITGRGSTLRVVALSDDDPSAPILLEVRGRPQTSGICFEVFLLCRIQLATDSPIDDLQFRPESLGDCIVVLQRSDDFLAISKHVPSVHDPHSFTESKRANIPWEGLEEGDGTMALSNEGSAIAICIKDTAPALFCLETLSFTDRLEQSGPWDCLTSVFSPNGVALAGAFKLGDEVELQIWSLSEYAVGTRGSADNPKSLSQGDANRLLWCLLTQADSWDICTRVGLHARSLQDSRGYSSLLTLDNMLHQHPYYTRPDYAETLDRVKIRVLNSLDDPATQAVLIDLCTRRMMDHLFRGLTATFARESSLQQHSFQPDEWSEADRASIRHWIQWIVDCAKTWAVRIERSSSSANLVPFIRLFADHHFLSQLGKVSIWFRRAAPSIYPPQSGCDNQFKTGCSVIADINRMLRRPEKAYEAKEMDPESFEAVEQFRKLVAQTRQTCPGPVYLHYARMKGAITPQLAPAMLSRSESIREARIMSQEEIISRATTLGFIPDKALCGFLKLRKLEKLNPYGVTDIPQTRTILPYFDIFRGRNGVQGESLFCSSDNTCIASFEVDEKMGKLEEALLKQSMARSIFTGTLWKSI